MKLTKRMLAIVLVLVMLASVIPLTVYAATPLKITTQPTTGYAQDGQIVKTTVVAQGDGLTYTWYIKNAGASAYTKSSVTKATYSTYMSDAANGRFVKCIVRDKYGNKVTTTTVALRMTATITAQPQNAYGYDGEIVKTTVSAKGDGLTYTWYIKNPGASSYTKSSITKPTYSAYMNEANNGRIVKCIVKDKYGNSVTTNAAVLRMSERPLTITQQPQYVMTQPGEEVTFSVAVIGGTAPYTYQWQDTSDGDEEWWDIGASQNWCAGQLTPALTFVAGIVDFEYNYRYRCVITDAAGNTVISEKAGAIMYPSIITQPESVMGGDGQIVSTTVYAVGADLTYTWYIKNPGATSYTKSSITKPTYSTYMSEAVDGRIVKCVIKDFLGNSVTTDAAVLRLTDNPVVITTQPQNVMTQPEEEVTFTVAVTGGVEPYTYQWQSFSDWDEEWWDIDASEDWCAGQLTESLTFVAYEEEFEYNYRYRCVITDAQGMKIYSNAAGAIKQLRIVTQPAGGVASLGETASVYVEAEGQDLTYTWYAKAPGATSYVKTEQDTDTYSVELTEENIGTIVKCIIKDKYGNSVTTNAAVLKLPAPLSITAQPQDAVASVDETVTLTVEVSAGTEPYTYQWQYICDGGEEWWDIGASEDWCAGQLTESLTFVVTSFDFSQNYRYRCVITDATGAQITSAEAKILRRFEITTQPQDAVASVDEEITFTVEAAGGTEPYTYQWQYICDGYEDWKNITELDESWSSGAYTNALRISVLEEDFTYNYRYRCVITDATGTQITSAEAKTLRRIEITTQPQNVVAGVGEEVTFTVEVSGGTAPYTYQWQCTSDGGTEWWDIAENSDWASGGLTPTLTFEAGIVDFEENYRYRCVITDAAGAQITSAEAKLLHKFEITAQPQDVVTGVDEAVTFTVEAAGGTAPYTYQWQYTNDDMDSWADIAGSYTWATGQLTDELSFVVALYDFNQNFRYRCVITDATGAQLTSAEAKPLRRFEITAQPQGVVASIGEEVAFTAEASGGTAPYTYQWQYTHDGHDGWISITERVTWATGQFTSELSFVVGASDFSQNYRYRCVITDAAGAQVISEEVRVVSRFAVTTQPSNATGDVSDEVTFTVAVSNGKDPYTYQWQYTYDGCDGWVNINNVTDQWSSGCDTDTLTVTVSGSDFTLNYRYRCVITDGYGQQVISNEARTEQVS